MKFNKQVNWQTHTGDVNGLWSNAAKAVQVLRVELAYCNDECDFGELRAYFNTSNWDCNIYSREDINAMSSQLGYDVWKRRGGWYHNPTLDVNTPQCRHVWKQELLRRIKR